jgi:hypothetical protein
VVRVLVTGDRGYVGSVVRMLEPRAVEDVGTDSDNYRAVVRLGGPARATGARDLSGRSFPWIRRPLRVHIYPGGIR